MDDKDFKKLWSNFLIDSNITNADVAKWQGVTRSAISQKVNNNSMRFSDFVKILEHYGYTIKIIKKEG